MGRLEKQAARAAMPVPPGFELGRGGGNAGVSRVSREHMGAECCDSELGHGLSFNVFADPLWPFGLFISSR